MRLPVWAGAALLSALAGCASVPPGDATPLEGDLNPYRPPRYAWSAEFGGAYHVVTRGQTLWRIARAYGVDLELLQWTNDLDDPSLLSAGRRLFIPGARETLEVEPYRPGESAPPVEALVSLSWPLPSVPVSLFGPREKGVHRGIDLPVPEGTPVEAAASGRVVYSGQGMSGYGNVVVIKHGEDWSTVYAHNRSNRVRDGEEVAAGQVIAESGATGRVTGPHLHFEVRRRGVAVDPLPLLPSRDAGGPS